MAMQNWRQAIRTPTAYRVGNNTIRLQTNFVYSVATVGVILLVILYLLFPQGRTGLKLINEVNGSDLDHRHELKIEESSKNYNSTYPLTSPKKSKFDIVYRIAIVADLDTNSKIRTKISNSDDDSWLSYMKTGHLTYNFRKQMVKIDWDEKTVTLKSTLSVGGRGMELSELVVFNGKLYSIDDRTGIVYEIEDDKVIPWVILSDGNGRQTKGFKGEWMTVKNEDLYVGGLGKEWTSAKGELINLNPQWIKIVSASGEVQHVDWHENYNAVRKAAGIEYPGYLIHESVAWSNVKQQWFFLPRRASHEKYEETMDEKRGTNLILRCSEDFSQIFKETIGQVNPTRGFSSFRFLPDTDDTIIVALKSEEVDGKIATFILAFTVDGKILLPETKIGDVKYEGLEFI